MDGLSSQLTNEMHSWTPPEKPKRSDHTIQACPLPVLSCDMKQMAAICLLSSTEKGMLSWQSAMQKPINRRKQVSPQTAGSRLEWDQKEGRLLHFT